MTSEEKRIAAAKRTAEWRKKNRARALTATREWRAKNKERCAELSKRWADQNPERVRASQSAYYNRNRENIISKLSEQWKALTPDSEKKIYHRLYNRMADALPDGVEFCADIEVLIGCSISEFRAYIEGKFTDGMNWIEGGWDVDHVKPCAAFDLSQPDQQKQCFHFLNTQPLWRIDNLKKHSKTFVNGVEVVARRKSA